MDDIIITLSTPEAIIFRDYQKYHDVFVMLQKQGVFDINFGKCTINFANGMVQSVSKEEVIYRKT